MKLRVRRRELKGIYRDMTELYFCYQLQTYIFKRPVQDRRRFGET